MSNAYFYMLMIIEMHENHSFHNLKGEKTMSKVSRREFLRGAASSAVGLVGISLIGSTVLAEQTSAQQPEQQADTNGINWDYEADIVVIGSGGAGLPAALRAMDEGLSVLIVEGAYDVGGRAALSGGNLHSGCGTEIQKKYGIEDSADRYYIDHTTSLTLESRYNDREYVRSVADHMVEAYEYILAKGVIIKDVEPMHQTDYTEGGNSPETVGRWTYCDQDAEDWVAYADGIAPSQGGLYREGIALTRPLERTYRKQGGKLILNYHMDKIFREGSLSGRALGIQAHYTPTILPGETQPMQSLWSEGNIDSSAEVINVKANKAIIIATGGSSGNVYFRTMIDPRRQIEYDCTCGDPFCYKDASGELAAMAIGACLGAVANQVQNGGNISKANMVGTQYIDSFATVNPRSPLFKLSRATGLRVNNYDDIILVNMLGQRFVDETMGGDAFCAAAMASVVVTDPVDGEVHRYGGPLWAIFDSEAVARHEWKIDDTSVDRADGRFFEADTLEELADKIVNKYYESIKMDPQTLTATIQRYNELVDIGVDEDFGKSRLPHKIQTGPFYAAWATPGLHDTTTGLRVNRKMQVMDLFGQPIPGLYCCGESSGGQRIHGLGRVITSGYIAGLFAASEG